MSERPVPNFEIFDFASQIENAFAAAATSLRADNNAKQRDSDVKKTPIIYWKFTTGAMEQRVYSVPNTGTPPWQYPNLFNGTLKAMVGTNRISDKGLNSHGSMVGLVRWIAFDQINLVGPLLKNLKIVLMLENAGESSFDTKVDIDFSTLTFNPFKFCILPAAFPHP